MEQQQVEQQPDNSHDFWVTIHGARGEEWKSITGTNRFPVISPIAVRGNLPGIGEAGVYLLALDNVAADVKSRIIAHLANKFGLSPDETEEEVRKAGIPILETDCSVTVFHPQKWVL